jgi:hypothetical protein
MNGRSSLSLSMIEQLRTEAEARPDLADGPIASLRAYAESSNEEIAMSAREALTALEDSDD